MESGAVDYVFTRDYLDNIRINLQHYQWVRLFGYHIHPSINVKREGLRVADVGTGTGVWLLDLSDSLPASAKLDGFDISPDALPPLELLPENVSYRQWDVRTDVPDDLIGVYDVVHIRLFVFVLQDQEVARVLQSLMKLLKPGGFLHWEEADIMSFRIEKISPDSKTTALAELISLFSNQDTRLQPHWVSTLPRLFAENGLQNILSDVKDAPGYMKVSMHETGLLIPVLVAQKGGNQEFRDVVEKLTPEVLRETQRGNYWAYTRFSVVGQKL